MNLRTVLRPTRATDDVGTGLDPARGEHDRRVREARLDVARRERSWTEVAEMQLVRRGRFWVDAESDLVFAVRRGHVFEPGRASVGYLPPNTPLTFYVDEDDTIVFLEEPHPGRTWSELVARKARRRERQ